MDIWVLVLGSLCLIGMLASSVLFYSALVLGKRSDEDFGGNHDKI